MVKGAVTFREDADVPQDPRVISLLDDVGGAVPDTVDGAHAQAASPLLRGRGRVDGRRRRLLDGRHPRASPALRALRHHCRGAGASGPPGTAAAQTPAPRRPRRRGARPGGRPPRPSSPPQRRPSRRRASLTAVDRRAPPLPQILRRGRANVRHRSNCAQTASAAATRASAAAPAAAPQHPLPGASRRVAAADVLPRVMIASSLASHASSWTSAASRSSPKPIFGMIVPVRASATRAASTASVISANPSTIVAASRPGGGGGGGGAGSSAGGSGLWKAATAATLERQGLLKRPMVVCLALPGSPVDLCWLASPSGSPATSYKLPNAGFAAAATILPAREGARW